MSDVNKLDDKQCPFDPEQYQVNVKVNDVVPEGSFPWALIQVYVGKSARRKGWDAQVEYIKLLPDSTGNNGLPQIEVVDKEGATSWQPTQEDMMACDWSPVDYMLSFDLKIGTQHGDYGTQWGYGANKYSGDFGTLTNLQNNLGIGEISTFALFEETIGTFNGLSLQFYTSLEVELKNLEVIVNGSIYNLGSPERDPAPLVIFNYFSDDARKLGDLLKQNVGNTLHFCFNWK
ncbi:hypothetical protein Xedl_00146 [Xenorhabdus eapokensis]|uniref:Uncharacterized protein n=2 Tax=Xenorhabdus eapokensis TaxID=1873482 RepID=A0A1Q5TZK8_9GAMM|nr:hypothetical protein Xedl_00146 [Xenorhabdus eapokensis]